MHNECVPVHAVHVGVHDLAGLGVLLKNNHKHDRHYIAQTEKLGYDSLAKEFKLEYRNNERCSGAWTCFLHSVRFVLFRFILLIPRHYLCKKNLTLILFCLFSVNSEELAEHLWQRIL